MRKSALHFLLPLCLTSVAGLAQATPAELHYKLATGDRLVYREVFDREGKSPDTTFRTQVVFANQLVVVDEAASRLLVGVQRNRQSTELLEYHERGKDALAQQKPKFEQSMAQRPGPFPDTNLFATTGQALLPVQVLREATSKLLYGISEIMPLPAAAVQPGAEWDLGALGLRMKLKQFDRIDGEPCAVVVDTGSRKDTHLQYTFCPGSGHLAKLVFDGEYRELDGTIHEKVTLELREVHHQEGPAAWLADQQIQLGALRAYVVAISNLPDAPLMNAVLKAGSPEAQALALAAYYQRRLTPPQDLLQPLLQSDNAEVRRIANRINQPSAKAMTQPCELPTARHSREKPGTTLRGMTSAPFTNAAYMIHVPIDYRGDQPFPLIVYLSGGGGLAFDGALTAGDAVNHAGYLVLYPHAGGDNWWEPKPTDMVHTLLLEVLRSYNVDTNRVYVAGFSNGGTGVLEFGTRWPDRFAALASLMGAGMNSPSGAKLPMQNLWDVPVLFLHGDSDPRIPFSASVDTYNDLRRLQPRVTPELHILKGRSHDITLGMDDGYTLPFFERFTRAPFPQSVSARIWDARFPRQYWMEVVDAGNGAPELEGRIVTGDLIEIRTRNVKKLRLLLRPELFPSAGPIRVRLNGRDQPSFELKRDCQLFTRSADAYADPYFAYTDEIVVDVPN
jgi:hypothetical protein